VNHTLNDAEVSSTAPPCTLPMAETKSAARSILTGACLAALICWRFAAGAAEDVPSPPANIIDVCPPPQYRIIIIINFMTTVPVRRVELKSVSRPCRCEPLRAGCCGGEGVLGVS